MASDCLGCLVSEDRLLRVPAERISIVEDDESCRESLHELLKAFGFDVQCFCSAEELLASRAWLGSACLIVDATLPGASGLQLQALLQSENNSIPLIIVTGYDDDELRKRAIGAGAIACLCKPYEEETLLLSLERAVGVQVVLSRRAAP